MSVERLNPRQQVFCLEYVSNGYNATAAAIKAGYSPESAGQIGCVNLTKPHIAREVKRLEGNAELDLRTLFNQYAHDAFMDMLELKEKLADPDLKMVKVLPSGQILEYSALDPKIVELRAGINKDIMDRAGYKPVEKREVDAKLSFEDAMAEIDGSD